MDDLVLRLALRWLSAVDAFAASCVSRDWLASLSSERDETQLWKQVCYNTNSIIMPDVDDNINYRRLALGLMYRRPIIPEPQEYPPPTLRPQDIFAVVEIYRVDANDKRTIEASWVSEISFEKKGLAMPENKQIVLKGTNPYSSLNDGNLDARRWQENCFRTSFPDESLPYNAKITFYGFVSDMNVETFLTTEKCPQIRVTLFRRDNMKSVCTLEQRLFDDWDFVEDEDFEVSELNFYNNSLNVRFDSTIQGNRAIKVLKDHYGGDEIECLGKLVVKAMLPPSGATDEAKWLRNARQAVEANETYIPNDSDITELRNVPSFGIQIMKDSEFHFQLADETAFRSQNDMMTALEGLCWR